jgi:hypothetical protein
MHLDLPDGTHIVHEFKGKNVYTKERYTDVEDPQIQKLLEASEAFGVYFVKSNEFDWMEAEEKAVKLPEVKTDPDIKETQPGESNVKVFTTGEQAKDWLNQTMNVPYRKLTNKAKIIEEGALLGYTIEFENN